MKTVSLLDETIATDDPFLLLNGIAAGEEEENMTNRQMDDIIY